MKATNILMEEHRIIEKLLACLQKIVEEAENNGKLNADSANQALDFFRNFADGCHHAKEEDRLFIVMQEHGVPCEGGPVGVMLMEHDDGRRHVRGMSRYVEKVGAGDAAAIRAFADHARDFIALLEAHIRKEDEVLFPMADQVLDEQVAESLISDFQSIEHNAGGNRHAKYIEIAYELCQRYGVPFVKDAEIQTINKAFLSGKAL